MSEALERLLAEIPQEQLDRLDYKEQIGSFLIPGEYQRRAAAGITLGAVLKELARSGGLPPLDD